MRFKRLNIETYEPGKSSLKRFHQVVKLSANESALGVSSKAKKILSNKNLSFFRYPDGKSNALRRQISKKFKCNEDRIICGAGSDEVIQMLCQLFLNPKDEVILPQYSFLMYRIYAKIVGAKVIFAKENNFKVSIPEIIKNVSKKTKIVFLANPNNPTGTYLTSSELLELRKKLRKNILLVVDDAYAEYMKNNDYKSGLKLFKNKQNVFILRTFSKIYGLSSLRVGWGYGSKKIIKALNVIKPPFNVNEVANQYGINSNNISANFLLLNFEKCKFKAKYFYEKLKMKGIILRSTENGYNIKNMLRLTIGSKTDNLKFMRAVKGMFN